jgi:two-component system, chemotaxis family, protein-glutamate methylesterase/glutaminase
MPIVMADRDIVVIGASGGGVKPLIRLVGGLPADLPAALFIVLHVNPAAPSHLPAILNRAGPLPAAHAVDGEPIRRGRIYVAPPGLQTYVQGRRIKVRRGPFENLHRPAIDPLFRTAAHHYGSRVVGVVLSGALDDGAAGLAAVKHRGGLAVVQRPDDAAFASMPVAALERVEADCVVPAEKLSATLVRLVTMNAATPGTLRSEVPLETIEEAAAPEEACRSDQLGLPSEFTCPDCSGTLFEIEEGNSVRFRCRVGHAYSEGAMTTAQGDGVERALWAALRALEERSALMRKLADRARRRGLDAVATAFEGRSRKVEDDVRSIHAVITSGGSLEPVE